MRFRAVERNGEQGIALVGADGSLRCLFASDESYPGGIDACVARGGSALNDAGRVLALAPVVDEGAVLTTVPIPQPGKIICVGLNYVDHTKEAGMVNIPAYPDIFARFSTSLVADGQPIDLPKVSHKLDFEAELLVVIGKGGRYISIEDALDHVVGYSVFNDGTIRDYQTRTSQWVLGKTFDKTGGFGPDLVTADELPPGAKGLKIRSTLNGVVMQNASTADMIFDVATLVSICSEAVTLEPGDIIATGTPAGIGHVRVPPVYMADGDVCEVSIESVGVLRNPICARGQVEAASV